MRIGFTGAQGTGKTSVATAARDLFWSSSSRPWRVVPSTARATLAAGYAINRDADPLSQLVTLIARINAENNTAEYANIISDRTPLDSLAYTAFQFNEIWKEPNAFYWTQCSDLVKHHMPKYDLVVLFPPYWEPVGDGVRDTDIKWQHQVHQMIADLLETMGVKHEVMPDVPVADRAAWLWQKVKALKSFDKPVSNAV